MRLLVHRTPHHRLTHSCYGRPVIQPGNLPVGVNDDEGWPNTCEDLVLLVSFNKIMQYFCLIHNLHLAHIAVEAVLSLGEEVCLIDCDAFCAAVSVYLALEGVR